MTNIYTRKAGEKERVRKRKKKYLTRMVYFVFTQQEKDGPIDRRTEKLRQNRNKKKVRRKMVERWTSWCKRKRRRRKKES